MNGDLMVDFDARQFLRFQEQSGSGVTVGVRRYAHTVPFGVVEHDDEHRIHRIVEKPTSRSPSTPVSTASSPT